MRQVQHFEKTSMLFVTSNSYLLLATFIANKINVENIFCILLLYKLYALLM